MLLFTKLVASPDQVQLPHQMQLYKLILGIKFRHQKQFIQSSTQMVVSRMFSKTENQELKFL